MIFHMENLILGIFELVDCLSQIFFEILSEIDGKNHKLIY